MTRSPVVPVMQPAPGKRSLSEKGLGSYQSIMTAKAAFDVPKKTERGVR